MTKSYNTYINNIIGESLTTNQKQFWSFIRQNKTEGLGIPILKVNNNLKTTDHDKANALNDHFKSVFTNEQLPIPTKGPPPFPSIQTLEIGLNGILKQLEALNSKCDLANYRQISLTCILCKVIILSHTWKHLGLTSMDSDLDFLVKSCL